jgi:GH15 family glucan-1,4-alpha-glucosidase
MNQAMPSSLSVPSLYLSNWQDMVGVWQGHALSKITPWQAPGLHELHFLGESLGAPQINHIVDWTGFFRDESGGYSYTQVSNFEILAWLESSAPEAGVLTTSYLTYHGAQVQPRCAITRSYAAVPGKRLLVIRYQLANGTGADITINILDQLHLANQAVATGQNVHGWYDASRRALIADMTASGQPFIALGAFQDMDGYQAGDDTRTSGAQCSGWVSFNQDGALPGNGDITAPDIDLAFCRKLVVPSGGNAEIYLYLTFAPDLGSLEAGIDSARAQSGAYWISETAQAHANWLAAGARPAFADDGLNTLFDRSLIVIKHSQNPATCPFPATTNPVAYQHFSWMRDSSITAIALDASEHHGEAGEYWQWMAAAQNPDGTWRTRSSVWDGSPADFVTPEYDSVGQFLYGACRHYQATGDEAFLNSLWPKIKLSADWILDHISPDNGLGSADRSIWEEDLEYNAFTQAWYVAGLYAAQVLAEARGDTALADWYAGGPASIISAIQRNSDAQPPGLWNPNGYINRSVTTGNTPRPLADSSTNILVALGILDPGSGRAGAHVGTILRLLTRDVYGLARYPHDPYYFDSPWDPEGDEAGGAEPSWPQMSMWTAVYEALTGDKDAATRRLQWFAATSGAGYMPQGEAVSNVTGLSVMSTMSEPLTAASYLIAALTCLGSHDPRLWPPIQQAGCSHTLVISPGAASDLPQWDAIPYFALPGASRGRYPASSLARCWIANDGSNLFLRIDNVAGTLPQFAADPRFAVSVYSADLGSGQPPALTTGLDGQPLPRPASFALQRRSDENAFRRWTATGGGWQSAGTVDVDIVPQWDPASGSIEVKIPLSAISTTVATPGDTWTHVITAIANYDQAASSWIDDSKAAVHYRLTATGDPAIYGNVTA